MPGRASVAVRRPASGDPGLDRGQLRRCCDGAHATGAPGELTFALVRADSITRAGGIEARGRSSKGGDLRSEARSAVLLRGAPVALLDEDARPDLVLVGVRQCPELEDEGDLP